MAHFRICQNELGFTYDDLVHTADNLMTYKYIVKNVARNNGKTATFMPKPIYGDNGSGCHLHQSLWANGKNLFFDSEGPYSKLSKLAMHYLGGILKHASAILAFTNPTTNSYKRLIPGYEAPCNLVYSKGNRSAAIRIPLCDGDNPKAKRLECRFPDAAACPYLAFAVLLMAGMSCFTSSHLCPTVCTQFELSCGSVQSRCSRVYAAIKFGVSSLEL